MEIPILQALRNKAKYQLLYHAVPKDMVGLETSWLLQWYGHYFEVYGKHEHVEIDPLLSLIKLRAGGDKEQVAAIESLVGRLREPVDPCVIDGVIDQLQELEFAGRVGKLLTQYNNGEDVDLTYELHRMSESAMRQSSQSTPLDWNNKPIAEILAAEANNEGLILPTFLLSTHVKALRPGDSITIAARPDQGKTSFLAFLLTRLAKQIPELHGDRPVLWFNNEGSSDPIRIRVMQSALNLTIDQLYKLGDKREEVYAKAVCGLDRIRIKDMHGASLATAERTIEAMNPCVVVWDMLANFRIGGSQGNRVEDTEARWQEVREMAVRRDFVSIGTAQVSAEGDNMLYPPMSALKDSKTGAQGASDVIIMLGSQIGMEGIRGISTPKNKRHVAGRPSYAKSEVVFQADTCTFLDASN